MSDSYEDIIHLPHHVSARRPRMSALDRAAQFSPFAALTGYDDAIQETLRHTERKIVLDEEETELLNSKLRFLASLSAQRPAAAITYFVPDAKKEGGSYITTMGQVKRIDEGNQVVVLSSGQSIAFQDILAIECEEIDNAFQEE